MVQLLLKQALRARAYPAFLAVVALLTAGSLPAASRSKTPPRPDLWQMSLDGGRSLTWQRSFNSEAEVKPNRGFWNKLVDVVAGEPDYHFLVRPYSVATDSRGRIIVTDPGAPGIHIFDFAQRKYRFIERRKEKDPMLAPQCVAVDAQDNLYVTDSAAGVLFVFNADGKYQRTIGKLKGGEGYFKRPTGVAVDSAAGRIYVTDTLRDQVFFLDMNGTVLGRFGQEGSGQGEFNYPTELRLAGKDLLVVDALNFRVQSFALDGTFEFAIGKIGDSTGALFRPKAVGVDSEGDVYIVDALWGVVQVFNRQGQLLYYFGARGTHPGEFQLPAGLVIDRNDRVYVVDSFNRRVQVFQYAGLKAPALNSSVSAGPAPGSPVPSHPVKEVLP